MPLFRRFFCTVAREGGRRSQLPARSRSTTSAARTTRTHARASTALKSRTNRTARARKQSTMPHALAATSRPAMTVRAFEIAPEKTARFDAPRGPGARPRGITRATRPGVGARVTRHASSRFRGPGPERRGRASREPASAGADDRRFEAERALGFFNRRMPATAASGRLLSAPRF